MLEERTAREIKIIVLLLILSLIVWGMAHILSNNEATKAAELKNHSEQVRSISIPDKIIFEDDESTITLVKDGIEWHCIEGDFYIDTTLTSYMFGILKHFEPVGTYKKSSVNLKDIGLLPPQRKICFLYSNGLQKSFYIGQYNAIAGLYYFMMENDEYFFTIQPEEAVFFLLKMEHFKPE